VRPLAALSRVLGVAILVWLGLLAILALSQRSMIYYPSRNDAESLEREARGNGFSPWTNSAGQTIGYCSLAAPDDARPPAAVLITHGNAGYAMHRADYAQILRNAAPKRALSVYILEYPGYGARSGAPSKDSLEAAAAELLEVVLARHPVPVYLIGESLGSGVATSLAASHPDKVSGLILVTPFTSLAAVGRHHYPFLPVRLLLRDNFDNVRNLKYYGGPVAVVLAEDDRVIPAAIGKNLHDAYGGPRRLWTQPGAGHNTLDLNPENPMWKEIIDFLKVPATGGPGS